MIDKRFNFILKDLLAEILVKVDIWFDDFDDSFFRFFGRREFWLEVDIKVM